MNTDKNDIDFIKDYFGKKDKIINGYYNNQGGKLYYFNGVPYNSDNINSIEGFKTGNNKEITKKDFIKLKTDILISIEKNDDVKKSGINIEKFIPDMKNLLNNESYSEIKKLEDVFKLFAQNTVINKYNILYNDFKSIYDSKKNELTDKYKKSSKTYDAMKKIFDLLKDEKNINRDFLLRSKQQFNTIKGELGKLKNVYGNFEYLANEYKESLNNINKYNTLSNITKEYDQNINKINSSYKFNTEFENRIKDEETKLLNDIETLTVNFNVLYNSKTKELDDKEELVKKNQKTIKKEEFNLKLIGGVIMVLLILMIILFLAIKSKSGSLIGGFVTLGFLIITTIGGFIYYKKYKTDKANLTPTDLKNSIIRK